MKKVLIKIIVSIMSNKKDGKENLIRVLKLVAYIATAIVSFLTGASI